MKERISYLDGHRGLAILLVLLYHAYSRWSEVVPYGDEFKYSPLFSNGWLGVNLFFMISGFVILMSLERSSSFTEFIYRRWLRLFPAMLICSLLVFFTADFFHERPAGSPVLRDLLPGLTFIEPSWWQQILASSQGLLEGAFWSLFVEFKFYIVASLAFFWFGRKAQVAILFGLFIATKAAKLVYVYEPVYILYVINKLFHQLSFGYFGWFASGAAFYMYVSTSEKKWLFSGIFMALVSSVLVRNNIYTSSTIVAVIISLFFAASVYFERVQMMLGNRILLFLGFVSYPLYLLHENMMVSMIVKLGNHFPQSLQFALPLIPVLLISGLAYIIAKYLEPPLKMLIRTALARLRKT